MALFYLRSKVCIALIHERNKVCKFAPNMDGSNVDFALYMEGSHAEFAPESEQKRSFRDEIIAKTASFVNCQRELFTTTNILEVIMTYVTTFERRRKIF